MSKSVPNPAAQLTSALEALAETTAKDGSVQIDVRVTVTSRRAATARARAVADAQQLQYERTAPPFRPDSAGPGHSLDM